MRPPLVPLLGLALLTACSTGQRKATRLEGRYDLGDPGDAWSRVKPGGADQAWFHAGISAAIYADSNCAARYDDRPLEKLADALVYGIATTPASREEHRTVEGRDALLRIVDGQVDGVAMRVGLLVLKKDACVYDLMYVAPPTTFDAGWDGFEQVVAGFATRSD